MFERYNSAARKVIFLARFEASQLNSTFIYPEHLLLGIVHEKDCWANAQMKLAEHGDLIRSRVSSIWKTELPIPASVDLPLDRSCKRILVEASKIATELDDPIIRPEHLLLGILHEPSTLAARLLKEIGVSEDSLRASIRTRSADADESVLDAVRHVAEPAKVERKVIPWPGVALGALGGGVLTFLLMKSC